MHLWQDIFRDGVKQLQSAGIGGAVAEMRSLLAQSQNWPDEQFEIYLHHPVTEEAVKEVHSILQRRINREPLARILGKTRFGNLEIHLCPTVFKPTRETEAMVDHVILKFQNHPSPCRILDLGTGTGCILLALLADLPNSTGLGIDQDETALAQARQNAADCGLAARADFDCSDWGQGVEGAFDLIITNPPRVPTLLLPHLVPEVRGHDPIPALDGGPDGLQFYRRTIDNFRGLATADGWGIVQVGPLLAGQVQALAQDAGFRQVAILADYKGMPVCVAFQNAPKAQGLFAQIKALWL
jgi:release factor glutamine methyltransferase